MLPAVALALSFGTGTVMARILGVHLSTVLLATSGFSATVLVGLSSHELGVPIPLAAAGLGLTALVGCWLGRHSIRPGWASLPALGVFSLYISPLVLSGNWSWTGYNFLNDTAVQFLLADWIREGGTPYAGGQASVANSALASYVATDYPLGSHSHLALLGVLVPAPVEVLYQSYLGLLGATGAAAAFSLVRTLLVPALAAAAAFMALAGSLTFHFVLQGSIKEIAVMSMLLVAGALGREVFTNERPIVVAMFAGLAGAAAFAMFSAAALPYVGMLGLLFALALVLHPSRRFSHRRRLLILVAAAGVLALSSLPTLSSILAFARAVDGIYVDDASTASTLGQLQMPLPAWQAWGVWLRGEYVFPLEGNAAVLTHLGAAGVALAAVAGVITSLKRREFGVLIMGVAVIVAWAYIAVRTTPYAEAKALAIAGPPLILLAAVGLTGVSKVRGAKVFAGLLATILSAGVLVSAAMAVRGTQMAPTAQFSELEQIAERLRDDGPVLVNEFTEFARYFARHTQAIVPTDPLSPTFIELRVPDRAFFGKQFDLDEQTLDSVSAFPVIVQRRSPATSRPPSSYRRVAVTRYYDVWRREAERRVLRHLPLGGDLRAGSTASCEQVQNLARTAPAGSWLVGARRAEQVVFDVGRFGVASPGWQPDPFEQGLRWMLTPGTARGAVRVDGGRYTVWVRGTLGRAVEVSLDGQTVGTAQGINTPGSWLRAGETDIRPGRRTVEVRREGGTVAPGDAARSAIGGVAFEAVSGGRLIEAPLSDASRFCRGSWDWIETVR
jgi:hypothetical protein